MLFYMDFKVGDKLRINAWISPTGRVYKETDPDGIGCDVISWHLETADEICESNGILYTDGEKELEKLKWIKCHVPSWDDKGYVVTGDSKPSKRQISAMLSADLINDDQANRIEMEEY